MGIRTARAQHNHIVQGIAEDCPACNLIRPEVMHLQAAAMLRDPHFNGVWSPIRNPEGATP